MTLLVGFSYLNLKIGGSTPSAPSPGVGAFITHHSAAAPGGFEKIMCINYFHC